MRHKSLSLDEQIKMFQTLSNRHSKTGRPISYQQAKDYWILFTEQQREACYLVYLEDQ